MSGIGRPVRVRTSISPADRSRMNALGKQDTLARMFAPSPHHPVRWVVKYRSCHFSGYSAKISRENSLIFELPVSASVVDCFGRDFSFDHDSARSHLLTTSPSACSLVMGTIHQGCETTSPKQGWRPLSRHYSGPPRGPLAAKRANPRILTPAFMARSKAGIAEPGEADGVGSLGV